MMKSSCFPSIYREYKRERSVLQYWARLSKIRRNSSDALYVIFSLSQFLHIFFQPSIEAYRAKDVDNLILNKQEQRLVQRVELIGNGVQTMHSPGDLRTTSLKTENHVENRPKDNVGRAQIYLGQTPLSFNGDFAPPLRVISSSSDIELPLFIILPV